MVVGDVPLFIFAVIDAFALLFTAVYFIITLSDLECDYLNARTTCERLNKFVLPEVVAHASLTIFLLLTFHWYLFVLNVPLAAWQVHRLYTKPSGDIGIYDPTEIHNRQHLRGFMKESMIKLGFHLILFFIYLYLLILALVSSTTSS